MLLTNFQEFTLVLVKLRLNVPNQDLACRLHVSRTVVSVVLATWLYIMGICLSLLIVSPSREALHRSMPMCFMDSFGLRTSVIIDCFEIFIDKPTNFNARAQRFSNYKYHCTVKVLIGITPQGAISFVSASRTSDKFKLKTVDSCQNFCQVIWFFPIVDLPFMRKFGFSMLISTYQHSPSVRSSWIQLTLKKQGKSPM